jgi:hypothetical protein
MSSNIYYCAKPQHHRTPGGGALGVAVGRVRRVRQRRRHRLLQRLSAFFSAGVALRRWVTRCSVLNIRVMRRCNLRALGRGKVTGFPKCISGVCVRDEEQLAVGVIVCICTASSYA